jgi:hypothetical protein
LGKTSLRSPLLDRGDMLPSLDLGEALDDIGDDIEAE